MDRGSLETSLPVAVCHLSSLRSGELVVASRPIEIIRCQLDDVPWGDLEERNDHTVFQRRSWLASLAESQRATPIALRIGNGPEPAWCFGLVIRRFGVRIFGSPFPGWGTPYIGISTLHDGERINIANSVLQYAISELGCLHAELADPLLDAKGAFSPRIFKGAFKTLWTDLTREKELILADFHKESRRVVRKSAERRVVIHQAEDPDAFALEYYAQLSDVFEKQGLVPPFSLERVRLLIQHLAPSGQVLLLQATHAERGCIGTTISVGAGRYAALWGTASYRRHQDLLPNEAMLWNTLLHWKARGAATFDWGGYAEYKARKYGGRPVDITWLRLSRFRALHHAREMAKRAYWRLNRIRATLRPAVGR